MEIKTALTLRASSIGDSLMAKYFLENIHAAYPAARCVILVSGKSAMVRDLLAAYPWIEVVEAGKSRPMGVFDAFKRLYPSDATVTQYSGRGQFGTASKLFARALTRQGRLAGFSDPWPFNRFLYDHLIPFNPQRALRLHERDALLSLGITPSVEALTLKPKEGSGVFLKLGVREKEYVVLNLFSGAAKRGISLSHQTDIARAVEKAYGMAGKIILTGAAFDRALMEKIKAAVPSLVLAPALQMQELITLVSKSDAVVSLDTGVAHIAAQTGTPLVVLRTCWGYNWWNKDQYPEGSIRVLAHDELCANGHIAQEFPECLAAVSAQQVVNSLTTLKNI